MIRKVVCGMSGGVDSAVTALILKKRGYEVTGLFMRNWDSVNEKGECQADLDLEDANYICRHLDIPLHEVNFIKQYWNDVFSELLKDYQRGLTPNPDIMCNKHIKFNLFQKYALEKLNGDAIATGHYARTDVGYDLDTVDEKKGVKLLTAADSVKDQTFFLCQISQNGLQKTIFPIGDLSKHYVRKIAVEAGLDKIAKKKESMGMCFIGSRNFHHFIEEYIEPKEGVFRDLETGKEVGKHKGVHYWTRGQRASLGGCTQPYFITDINSLTNDIFVAHGTNHPALFCQTFFTEEPHWIRHPPRLLYQDQMFDAYFRFQHIHPLVKCTATLTGGNGLIVSLERPMRAICPGQYAVFYNQDECLGSAKIIRPGPSLYTLNYKEHVDNPKEFR
ncbi:hypothetical protein SNE40_015089 [Patella caerulea]|uniref:tRNA-5-taurinomethyluridine 2-sulfurtransferase n=1 Tax=Patella caerulea TaxID=87958 RepID=A0AAN8JIJ1_PATCE